MQKHSRLGWGMALLLLLPLAGQAGTEVNEPPKTDKAAKPEKSKADKTVAAAPAPEEKGSGFDIPLPVGQTTQGVVVQNLDQKGRDLGTMKANEATRISDEEVELGDLRLKIAGTANQPLEVNISIDKAVFNVKTSILKSRSRVHIQRADFDLYGDALEFDTITGAGQLFGETTMIIHDASKLTAPAPDAASKRDDSGLDNPAPTPALAAP